MLTPHLIADAANWGDGLCLTCGGRQGPLTSSQSVISCESCGAFAVVPAETLIHFLETLYDPEGDQE